MRAALRLAGAGALCSTAGVGAYAQHDEGTARSMTFWYHAFPVWAQYRAVQWRKMAKSEATVRLQANCSMTGLGSLPRA